jgi:protein phosphatase
VTELRYAGLTDRGRVRTRNEDRWAADPELGLFVVSDGMGGAPAGALASEIVVTALPALVAQHFGPETDLSTPAAGQPLRSALAELSAQLRDSTAGRPRLVGMGATVAVALVSGANVLIAQIGDSRAYLWRERHLRTLTRDHSLAQALLDAGEITAAEAAAHPERGRLTRHIGMEADARADVRRVTPRPADRLLLCSDGLTGMIDDDGLSAILDEHAEPEDACRALVEAANEAGGMDNITALVIAF